MAGMYGQKGTVKYIHLSDQSKPYAYVQYICIYIYIYIYIYACAYIYIYIHICVCAYIYIYTDITIYTYLGYSKHNSDGRNVRAERYSEGARRIRLCVAKLDNLQTCVCICIYTHTHIHTHTHTHTYIHGTAKGRGVSGWVLRSWITCKHV